MDIERSDALATAARRHDMALGRRLRKEKDERARVAMVTSKKAEKKERTADATIPDSSQG